MADDQERQSDERAPIEDVKLDPEEALYVAAEHETTKHKRRRRGFRSGLIFGIVAGVVGALVLRPKSAAEQTASGGQPTADVDGTIAGLRSRLREAADEAGQAAHEAEEAKRTRFSELLERE